MERDEYFDMSCACKGANLDKMLQACILQILSKKGLYGIALVDELGRNPMFRGSQPDKAGVYRYLKKMEQQGVVRTEEERDPATGRLLKIYHITDQGKRCLLNWYLVLQEYTASLSQLTEAIRSGLGLSSI